MFKRKENLKYLVVHIKHRHVGLHSFIDIFKSLKLSGHLISSGTRFQIIGLRDLILYVLMQAVFSEGIRKYDFYLSLSESDAKYARAKSGVAFY